MDQYTDMGFGKFAMMTLAFASMAGCTETPQRAAVSMASADSLEAYADGTLVEKTDTLLPADSLPKPLALPLEFAGGMIDTKGVKPGDVVAFAQTLIGTRYCYASTDPAAGFDCSGFITHVFHHFGIAVPRSSVDFTNVGREVPMTGAQAGDLVLFTGTDSTRKVVGHMGLVVRNENGVVEFIHSSSGKANGVTVSPLADYYRSRYVKTIRIF